MTDSDNSGPAFPQPHRLDDGMSLRDYFAAKAMQGLMNAWVRQDVDDYQKAYVAADAYEMADAMLRRRDALIAAGGEHE